MAAVMNGKDLVNEGILKKKKDLNLHSRTFSQF